MPPKGAQQKAKAAARKTVPTTPTKPKAKVQARSVSESESESEDEEGDEEEHETPSRKTPLATPMKSPVKTPRSRQKPRSQTIEFALLGKFNEGDEAAETPIVDVSVGNEEQQAEAKKKGGGFEKLVKLDSANKFEVLKTFMLTEGPDEGCQVILIRPAKPFDFLGLPKQPRAIIFDYYFANKGVVGSPISLDGKRKGLVNDIYAKTYSSEFKSRVGLLSVNKEIYREAVPVFYSLPIRFESTSAVMDFMAQIETSIRPRLVNIHIKTYQKSSARNALSLLAECKNLVRLHFETGVFSEGDPQKCAKSLYTDAHKFLQTIGVAKGRKDAGVDVLSFDKGALTFKDKDGKSIKPWSEQMVQEMKESLKDKLK